MPISARWPVGSFSTSFFEGHVPTFRAYPGNPVQYGLHFHLHNEPYEDMRYHDDFHRIEQGISGNFFSALSVGTGGSDLWLDLEPNRQEGK